MQIRLFNSEYARTLQDIVAAATKSARAEAQSLKPVPGANVDAMAEEILDRNSPEPPVLHREDARFETRNEGLDSVEVTVFVPFDGNRDLFKSTVPGVSMPHGWVGELVETSGSKPGARTLVTSIGLSKKFPRDVGGDTVREWASGAVDKVVAVLDRQRTYIAEWRDALRPNLRKDVQDRRDSVDAAANLKKDLGSGI